MKKIIISVLLKLAYKLGHKSDELISYGTTTRVYKSKIAPDGKIWYVIHAFKMDKTYTNAVCFSSVGINDEKRILIYSGLVQRIKKQYGI